MRNPEQPYGAPQGGSYFISRRFLFSPFASLLQKSPRHPTALVPEDLLLPLRPLSLHPSPGPSTTAPALYRHTMLGTMVLRRHSQTWYMCSSPCLLSHRGRGVAGVVGPVVGGEFQLIQFLFSFMAWAGPRCTSLGRQTTPASLYCASFSTAVALRVTIEITGPR